MDLKKLLNACVITEMCLFGVHQILFGNGPWWHALFAGEAILLDDAIWRYALVLLWMVGWVGILQGWRCAIWIYAIGWILAFVDGFAGGTYPSGPLDRLLDHLTTFTGGAVMLLLFLKHPNSPVSAATEDTSPALVPAAPTVDD